LIDGALNSKSIINFNGEFSINVDSSDLNSENEKIAAENRKAIHDALNEV